MQQQVKHSKLLITLVLLVFAVLCVTSVTYSYFTTSANKNETLTFGDLKVQFAYREKDSNGNPLTAQPVESGTLMLYSASGPIRTGVEFELALTPNGNAIHSLGILNNNGSCDCFIRFWNSSCSFVFLVDFLVLFNK